MLVDIPYVMALLPAPRRAPTANVLVASPESASPAVTS
jgi:hypothetical protein